MTDEGILTRQEQAHLARICKTDEGWWIETNIPIDKPLPPTIASLVEKGLVKASDKGRCGPLRVNVGVWIVHPTAKGRVLARMLS